MHPDYIAIFGNTFLRKSFCRSCKAYSIVLDGEIQCCGREVDFSGEGNFKIESQAEQRRIRPAKLRLLQILEEQEGKCFYCGYPFTQLFIRKGKVVAMQMVADHKVPFSYMYNNKDDNFVIACHICNGIKSNKHFESKEQAQEYIMGVRDAKGYEAV